MVTSNICSCSNDFGRNRPSSWAWGRYYEAVLWDFDSFTQKPTGIFGFEWPPFTCSLRRKTLKNLPQTDGFFALHAKRCIYQWPIMLQVLMPRPSYLSSLIFGREMKNRCIVPIKSTLPAWPSTIQKTSPYSKCKSCGQKCPCADRSCDILCSCCGNCGDAEADSDEE